MKSTTTTILTSGALMLGLGLGLTGCASTEMQQQEVPSATSKPSASASATPGSEETTEAPAEAPADTPWVEPTFDATIPENVAAAYADSVSTLEEQGEALVSLTQTQMSDLQAAREGDEAGFYIPLQEVMTGTAWQNVQEFVGDGTQDERLASLVPQADRAGVYGTFDGVDYTAMGGGIYAYPIAEPVIALDDRGVSWTQEMQYQVYAEPSDLTYTSEITLILQPGPDGSWLIEGWNASPTSAVEVSE